MSKNLSSLRFSCASFTRDKRGNSYREDIPLKDAKSASVISVYGMPKEAIIQQGDALALESEVAEKLTHFGSVKFGVPETQVAVLVRKVGNAIFTDIRKLRGEALSAEDAALLA